MKFNKKENSRKKYKVGDIVAIKRMLFGKVTKLKEKYLELYNITAATKHDRNELRKIRDHEGPGNMPTGSEYVKPWPMP